MLQKGFMDMTEYRQGAARANKKPLLMPVSVQPAGGGKATALGPASAAVPAGKGKKGAAAIGGTGASVPSRPTWVGLSRRSSSRVPPRTSSSPTWRGCARHSPSRWSLALLLPLPRWVASN